MTFSQTQRQYVHEHCWCQLVFVQPLVGTASMGAGVAHSQCCVCGDRKIKPEGEAHDP